ncbi:sorting nexin-15 isoform X3 [Eptesicus fuscus]|uniref:sorting nexin-15 isoform X3 n=1 Tax=Eptesicus fuscus TaxID=29078 RepID=UPI002403A2D4|nr:sorting nexin-15 isoform X3 [Eptesicus fuscus]
MSRRAKDDFLRHYTVSDPRTHPKGYTEYKVTAQFISKRDPEDVKEVVVWKRYSDFRKLHGDLAYTHRNLFRRLEEFPAFPRAQVFGRFEASVIEERRKGAEDLLRFTVHIPALNNSPQLKEFFRGGEVTRPTQVSRDLHILPPPLIPTPPPEELQPPPDESWLPQPLPTEKRGLEELEVPAEPLPSSPAQEALDLLFNCGSTEEASSSPARGPLTEAELALFDPFSKEDSSKVAPMRHSLSLWENLQTPDPPSRELRFAQMLPRLLAPLLWASQQASRHQNLQTGVALPLFVSHRSPELK